MPEPSRRALQLPPAVGRLPLTTDNLVVAAQMRPQPPLQQPTGGRRSWRAHGEASVGSSVAGGVPTRVLERRLRAARTATWRVARPCC